METNERKTISPLIARLAEKPHGFNLFQAISLIERERPHLAAVGTSDGRGEALRLSSVVSLGFPGSDLNKITFAQWPDGPYKLSTGVMSLAGANGPLPIPFSELVISRTAAKDYATADFLDIFNHRLLSFLYRGRKKHNMGLSWQPPQSSAIAACLDYLSALGLKAGLHAPKGEVLWLRHAGLLSGAPRSMSGLLTLIADRFGIHTTGQQFCGMWRKLEPRDIKPITASLGAPQLGKNAVLGRQVWDQSAGITLTMRNLTLRKLQSFLPDGDDNALLGWMIRRYLQMDVTVVIELNLHSREQTNSVLSANSAMRLGWTSWLGKGSCSRLGPASSTKFILRDSPQFVDKTS